LTSWRKGE